MKKRKLAYLCFCLVCMLFFVTACGKENPSLADDVFLKVSVTAYGESVETYEMYTLNLEIHRNGMLRCYADDFNRWISQEEIPEETMWLSKAQVKEIENLIEATDLYHMRERISSPDSKNGEYKSLTVYTTDGEHRTGGLNPSNRDFLKVYDYIDNLTKEMVYTYRSEITRLQKKGLIFEQNKGLQITDSHENEIIGNEQINDVYVTYGDTHERYIASDTDGMEADNSVDYYVTVKVSDDIADELGFMTAGCNEDLPEYYKVFENQRYSFTFGVVQPVMNGELYIYKTSDVEEAENMATQFRSSVYD